MALITKIFIQFIDFMQLKIEQESLSYFFAGFCLILLPIYSWFIPPFVTLWALARIVEIYVNKKKGRTAGIVRENLTLAILFVSFFSLQVISLIHSENLSNGLNIVLSRLSLLIFPVLFISPGRKIYNNRKLLLKLFAGGTVIYIIFCFIYAFTRSISYVGGELIINTHPPEGYWLSYFFGSYYSVSQHPSYTAIFVVLSILIAFEAISDNILSRNIRTMWVFSMAILFSSLYFLSSRTAIIIISLVIPAYVFFKLQGIKKIIFASALVIIFLTAGYLVIRTNDRFGYYLDQFSDGSIKDKIEKDSRTLIWKSSFEIIRDNLLFGIGIGDVRDELVKKYESIGDKELIESRYNAHNQYIEVTLEGGIISLVAFLLILGYLTYTSIKKRNLLLMLFIIIMVIFFMFETVLYRLAGVISFSYLSFLFLQNVKSES